MARAKKKVEEIQVEEQAAENETVIETAPEQEKKTYSADEVQALLAAMQAQIDALKKAGLAQAPAKEKERVVFRWQAPVAKENVLEIGPGGRFATITGPEQTFSVPKEELSVILTAQIRHLLDLRWLIVLSGLDEYELEAIGCNYKPGEVLDKQAFHRLVDLGEEIVPIYGQLCEGNREIVAKALYETWTQDRGKIRRDIVNELRKLDPEQGAFRKIIEEMTEREAK